MVIEKNLGRLAAAQIGNVIMGGAAALNDAEWVLEGVVNSIHEKVNRPVPQYGGEIHDFATQASGRMDPMPVRLKRSIHVLSPRNMVEASILFTNMKIVEGVILALDKIYDVWPPENNDPKNRRPSWPNLS